MQFVQTFSRNCCLSDLKSPSKIFTHKPQTSACHLKTNITSKKSLKSFATLKSIPIGNTNKVSQSKVTRDKSVSTTKSIIDKIYEQERCEKIYCQKVLSRSPQKMVNPQAVFTFPKQNNQVTLNRIKSLPKMTFNNQRQLVNPFELISNNQFKQNKQSKYEVKINSMRTSNLTAFIQESSEQVTPLFMSFMKKIQEDEDLRSTMEPFLHIPQKKKFGKGPKSIISMNDQEQSCSMNQSIILEKHSSSKRLTRLI